MENFIIINKFIKKILYFENEYDFFKKNRKGF